MLPPSEIPIELGIIQNDRELRFRTLELQRQFQEANPDLLGRSAVRRFLDLAFVRMRDVAVLRESPIRSS